MTRSPCLLEEIAGIRSCDLSHKRQYPSPFREKQGFRIQWHCMRICPQAHQNCKCALPICRMCTQYWYSKVTSRVVTLRYLAVCTEKNSAWIVYVSNTWRGVRSYCACPHPSVNSFLPCPYQCRHTIHVHTIEIFHQLVKWIEAVSSRLRLHLSLSAMRDLVRPMHQLFLWLRLNACVKTCLSLITFLFQLLPNFTDYFRMSSGWIPEFWAKCVQTILVV